MSTRVNSATTNHTMSTSRKFNFYMKSKNASNGQLARIRPASSTGKETLKSQNLLTDNPPEHSEGYLFDYDEIGKANKANHHNQKSKFFELIADRLDPRALEKQHYRIVQSKLYQKLNF